MADTATVERVRDAYRDTGEALRAGLHEAITLAWTDVERYDDKGAAGFVRDVVPVAEATQAQMATLTDAYHARLEQVILGRAARPVGVAPKVVRTVALRGVDAVTCWTRPAITVRTELSRGATFDDARDRGLTRAHSIADTNLQLARTHASRDVLRRRGNVVGYRRVPRGASSCALCLLAATQRYRSEDLMPIHPGCDCGVHQVYGAHDPGQVLDPDARDAIHERVGAALGISAEDAREAATGTHRGLREQDYRKVVIVREHGELGPVLARRGQHFSGPAAIAL